MRGKVTIKDIAREAGVSHPTVSRVIHGTGRIAPGTRKHVQAVMKRMGYVPNLLARGLVSRKIRVIAAIMPDFNPHVTPIFRGIADECRLNEYALMVFSTEYWSDERASYLSVVQNWQVDGVILYNVVYRTSPSAEELDLLHRGAPVVFANKYLNIDSVDTVSVDNTAAVRLAVDHLVRLGHRRIGILNGGLMSVDGVERRAAFRQAMEFHGLMYDDAISGNANFSDAEAAAAMRRILGERNPPTAMFCANDLMAMGACRAIEEAGLRVPDDISLVGFDDVEAAGLFSPALTTIQPPLREIGHEALTLLMARIRDPTRPYEQIPLSTKLVIRDSTGPCRARRALKKRTAAALVDPAGPRVPPATP